MNASYFFLGYIGELCSCKRKHKNDGAGAHKLDISLNWYKSFLATIIFTKPLSLSIAQP